MAEPSELGVVPNGAMGGEFLGPRGIVQREVKLVLDGRSHVERLQCVGHIQVGGTFEP